jgi:hypothetical protein
MPRLSSSLNLRILRVTGTERPSPTTNCSDESPKVKIPRWGQGQASSMAKVDEFFPRIGTVEEADRL